MKREELIDKLLHNKIFKDAVKPFISFKTHSIANDVAALMEKGIEMKDIHISKLFGEVKEIK
jgi:hypothetical protein